MRKTFCDKCGNEITEDVTMVFNHELCPECANAVDDFITHSSRPATANWHRLPDDESVLVDHWFYLVTHADYGTPMKAKYHDDLGGYFEIMNKKDVPVEYIDPMIGKSKIKYFAPMPVMPDDYKE